ncbi:MAG TPA: hypothetical protein VKA19_11450 [Alphaproteobacteria bacterium]|nr:hypothetical protein [Alphaproteobacteria bacterium]
MALDDTGLLVRYPIDEAASGTSPTHVLDIAGGGYDLAITYDGVISYIEPSAGHRGLGNSTPSGAHRIVHAINDTSDLIRDAIDGATALTIEIVADITALNASGGRLFGVNGRSGQNGRCMMKVDGSGVSFALNDQDDFSIDPGTGRTVFHARFDASAGGGAGDPKLSIWRNGSQAGWNDPSDTSITLPSSQDLIGFNRESGGSFDRSFGGALHYAAIYTVAMTGANISNNATELALNDDPGGGGGGGGGGSALPLMVAGAEQ